MIRSSKHSVDDLANLFGMLSKPTRLQIVMLLAKGESSVGDLCEKLKLPQPLASHHLGLLRMNGMILGNRRGKEVIYSLPDHVKASAGKLKVSLSPLSVTVEGY